MVSLFRKGKQSPEGSASVESTAVIPKASQVSYDPHTPLGPRVSRPPLANADDELLHSLGYKADLKREFSPLELFGVSFSIMSLAPSIASILVDQIPAGGVGLTWGWFVPCVFIMSIGITMSEMASAMPTAGGLYWWTHMFAPDKWKSYLSFLCGYSDTLGLIGGVGSINYGAASQVLSSVEMGTDYSPSDGVTYAVFLGITLLQCACCCLPNRVLAKFQSATIFLNIVAVVLICIALPVGLKVKGLPINSGEYVFGDTTNQTSYPYGMSFMLAWMAAIWTISSQDSCVHMAEEAANAATAVPFGILLSVFLCWIFGWLILCVIAAVIDPSQAGVEELMGATLPMANIIERCLNSKWAIGIMSLFSVIQSCMGLSALLSTSRQVYAFARDDALPFSRYLKQTTKGQLPIPALLFSTLVAALIGLLILAGAVAANAIFSLGMSALYLGWCLPIFVYSFSNKRIVNPGPFYLGHFWSKANGILASAFGIYVICALSMLPADIPVESSGDMNYSCVVCGAVWLGASLYWLFDARKWYDGPKMTLEDDEEIAEVIEAREHVEAEMRHSKKDDEAGAPEKIIA